MDCVRWVFAKRMDAGIIGNFSEVLQQGTRSRWLMRELTVCFRKDVVLRTFAAGGFNGVEVRTEHIKINLYRAWLRPESKVGIPEFMERAKVTFRSICNEMISLYLPAAFLTWLIEELFIVGGPHTSAFPPSDQFVPFYLSFHPSISPLDVT